jgi:hypothetical protein
MSVPEPDIVPTPPVPVHAYRASTRGVRAVLFALSRASLPAILVLMVLADDPPVTPPLLVRLVLALAVVPGVAAWLVGRATRAHAEVGADDLVLARRGLRIEVPRQAIAAVEPWRVPLPRPGVTLRLRSGRALAQRLELDDPSRLLAALDMDVGPDATVAYARARAACGGRRWYHLLGRFPLFALFPTAFLFNVHQHIAYGGLLGEYYLLGPRAWLMTLAVYWTTVTIQLVLYASVWRGLVELASLLAAHVAPSSASRVRRAAERTAQVLYYGGVPVLLGIRFLPW